MGRLDKLYKTDVPHRAKLVYIYLHDRMDKERKAWPGLNTIASHLSLSRSTVKRAVKDLEKAGLILQSILSAVSRKKQISSAKGELCLNSGLRGGSF